MYWKYANFYHTISILDVKAHGFKSIDGRTKPPIVYSLYADDNGDGVEQRQPSDMFSVDRDSGVVYLQSTLDYDDTTLNRVHKLRGI